MSSVFVSFVRPLLTRAILVGICVGSQLWLLADTEATLGGLLHSDRNLSINHNQSCASCHSLQRSSSPESTEILPALAFADLENIETGTPVSRGSIEGRTGALNTPSAGYAAFSPDFHWDDEEGLYVGGQFWNGRAATLQAQVEEPFLNPNEMAMPSKWAVVARIKENATYQTLFSEVFGIDLEAVPASDLASTKCLRKLCSMRLPLPPRQFHNSNVEQTSIS